MDQQQQQLIDRIKQAQNVLVTVSGNPSVDQLSAAIGLTIALNKMDKHGTAVFSGEIPSTIEFLKPEDTLEKNTDSLRDFIIALDKSKADKLRYKVEDQVVRIFITPYKTSLNEKDLEFSQGDFNVDVVIALGVADQKDIDSAITAHGRILHDATVTSVGLVADNNVGSINWVNTDASSLSEMMLGLIDGLDKKLLDNQIATALLTGIVASTDRFRNEKTSPRAMSVSAELMSAGANPQLIATELETPPPPPPEPELKPEPIPELPEKSDAPALLEEVPEPPRSEPGELAITHDDERRRDQEVVYDEPSHDDFVAPEPPMEEEEHHEPEPPQPQIHVDDDGNFLPLPDQHRPLPEISQLHVVRPDGTMGGPGPREVRHERLDEPPTLETSNLTANSEPEDYDPSTDELSLPTVKGPLLSHNENVLPPEPMEPPKLENPFIPQAPLQPAPDDWQPPMPPAPSPAPLPPLPPTPTPMSPPPFTPPPVPMPTPPAPGPLPSLPPLPPQPSMPAPTPMAPPVPPAPASLIPGETLADIEAAVHSSHLQGGQPVGPDQTVADARSAVQAAFSAPSAPQPPLPPISALNAQPLGADLHQAEQPQPSNMGFSEPTPGNTPADETLDMPLPANPFGPGQPTAPPLPQAPPSSFPAPPPQPGTQDGGQTPPPPVPPPMLPPLS